MMCFTHLQVGREGEHEGGIVEPNEGRTAKAPEYSAHETTRICPNLAARSSFLAISSVEPTIFIPKNVAAAPPPNANKATRFPLRDALSTLERSEAIPA